MKRGRKTVYDKARTLTLLLPSELIEKVEAAEVPDAYSKSRNAKMVALLEQALDQLSKSERTPMHA